jgi:hypothetical protein
MLTTAHITSNDIQMTGDYESTGDVLYLSTPDDDKHRGCEATPEGHAVRFDDHGRITHITVIGAKWYLDRDGVILATLRDGRQIRFERRDVEPLLG